MRGRRVLPMLAVLAACVPPSQATTPSVPAPSVVETSQPSPAPWPGRAHLGAVQVAAVAPSGTAALSLGEAGDLRLWTALDGRPPLPLPLDAPLKGPAQLDIIGDGDVWRAAMVADGRAHLFQAEASGRASRERVIEGAHAAVLLPDGAVLVATAEGLSLLDREGATRASVPLPEAATALVPTESRQHVLVAMGEMVETDVVLLWSDGAKVEAFRGSMTAVSIEPEHGLRLRGEPFAFQARSAPDAFSYALSDDGGRIAWLRDAVYEDALDEDGVAYETEQFRVIEQADLERGTRAPTIEAEAEEVRFDAEGNLVWPGKEGSAVEPRPTDYRCGQAVCVQPQGNLLAVREGEDERWLGAAAFRPSAVAFSPDGRRLAWAENRLDGHGGERTAGLRVGAADADVPGPLLTFEELESVTGLVWHGPDEVLVVSGEGGLFSWNPDRGRLASIGGIGTDVVEIEHEPRADATLVMFDDGTAAVVRWVDGAPTRAVEVQVAPEDAGPMGLQGQTMWWGTARGLATVPLSELWRDPAAATSLEPLSRRADEVFDVVSGPEGVRVVDWGDGWEVEGAEVWQRHVPIFGPLRVSADGSASMNLPRCDDEPWQVLVHPAAATTLQASDSYALPIPQHADVQWSPDGTTLAIASPTEGGMLYDAKRREITRRWTRTTFAVVEDAPLPPGPAPGRCVPLWDEE